MGVHIADVSYFVEEDNALDDIASQRATSVYMVQKVGAPWDIFNDVLFHMVSYLKLLVVLTRFCRIRWLFFFLCFHIACSAVLSHLSLHHLTCLRLNCSSIKNITFLFYFYLFIFFWALNVCCHCAGDPHVAEAALWGTVQSESSHRQAHFLCHLENHTRGEGMTI